MVKKKPGNVLNKTATPAIKPPSAPPAVPITVRWLVYCHYAGSYRGTAWLSFNLLQRHNTSVTVETVTLQAYKQVRTGFFRMVR